MSEVEIGVDEARQRLYEIMNRDEPFAKKAEAALELGVTYLGVEHGHVAKINPRTDRWEAVTSTDPDDGRFPVGLVCDLRQTYCRRTIERETSLAIHEATADGWADDPAFDTHGLECYHGTTISLDDETFGTVCFVSTSPRDPFTDGETMFAELIARLLQTELERQRHEAALTRQSNLSNVLNRVLRHNLRNSMAVIRGRTERIVQGAPAETNAAPILEHADRLIELGEKARSLESVLVNHHPRKEVGLRSVLDRVVRSVERSYPDASIRIDCEDDISLAVRPSLETALEELVENAAKHGGDTPTVTISATAVTDSVQIRIADDGPGLADTEMSVLTDGVETPLSHGTGLGLWLSYWIVSGHDGTIAADTAGNGTEMTIRLPRQADATASAREPELARVQSKFRAVFEESSDAMLIANDDGRYLDANEAAGELFGLSRERLLGRSIDEFAPDGFDFAAAWEQFQRSDSARGTFPLVRPDGTQRTVEYTAKSDIVQGQHLTILRDVTEQESRKQELELAETVFENVQDAVFLIDVVDESEFYVGRVNEAYETLTGLSNDDIQGQRPTEIVGDEIGTGIESRYRDCVERRETIQYPETIPVDGEPRHWETKLTPVVEDGTVVKLVGAMRDVTDQKRRQRELELKNQAIEDAPIGITIADASQADTPLVYVNEAFQELTGYRDEAVRGRNCRFMQGDGTDPATADRLRTAVENGETASVDILNYRADGDEFWNHVTVSPVENGSGETTHIVGFQQDITERRARERERRELEQVLDTVLSNAPVVFWTTDEDGEFTRSRGRALGQLGFEPGEVVGKSAFDVFEDQPASRDCVRRALDGECVAETLQIGPVVFDAWFQPVRSAAGDVVGTVGLAYDVTSREQPTGEHAT